MASRRELCLEEKMNLIKEKELGVSHRQLCEKFQISLGSVSNILKRKCEYLIDYETNRNKKVKRKCKNDLSQTINDNVFEWFVAQRGKNIPISGPIIQEYAIQISKKLDPSNELKASNGWLDRFRTRYNINFRVISGESRAVNQDTIIDWKTRLHNIIEHYDPVDVFNCDETGLFYELMPDRSLTVDKNDCKGGKKSKERYTVMLCTNWAGNEKLKPVVIGKSARPRCFRKIDLRKLPVLWYSNRSSWMTCKIFTEWLQDLDLIMRKQKRHILLFLDNAPVHPPDVQLENIKLKFFPPNTTAKIQPMDQGVIRAFKAYYRRHLVKHIIASAGVVMTADDINITALDVVYWIQGAWEAVTETTIQNTFKSAGFEQLSVIDGTNAQQQTSVTDEIISAEDQPIEELDRVLKHLTVGGKAISGYDYVSIDDNAPSFNEWDDSNDKLLIINGITNDDGDSNEDQVNDNIPGEDPPSLSECLHLVHRLRLFSTMQQPELHSFIMELQSKLTDTLLDSNLSKQKSILDYFKHAPVESCEFSVK